MNFSDFYAKEQESQIDEGFFTAMMGKLSTSVVNIFRKRKGINIALDFMRIFQPTTRQKYEAALNQLTNYYLNKEKRKGLFIKDIRFGELTGKFWSLNTPESQAIKKIPNAADPVSEKELYKSKRFPMDISVYLLSNGGKVSFWNLPKTGTDPENTNYNADNRVYAIGSDNAGVKAFETLFGMSFQNWLVTQQTAQEKEVKDKDAKEKEQPWKEIVEINEEQYNKILELSKSNYAIKNIEKTTEYPKSDKVLNGTIWNIIKPEGFMAAYQTTDKKYKVAFSDKTIRDWVNKWNYNELKVPSGRTIVAPESIQFKKGLV
jgi:hypothetical protein